jgi:hypothetical protein
VDECKPLSDGPTTMERVEDTAEIALELARPRAMRGGGCGWTRAAAAELLPGMVPAAAWDRSGMAAGAYTRPLFGSK